VQELSEVYTSPFLDTGGLKWLYGPEKFPGLLRNGPLVRTEFSERFTLFTANLHFKQILNFSLNVCVQTHTLYLSLLSKSITHFKIVRPLL